MCWCAMIEMCWWSLNLVKYTWEHWFFSHLHRRLRRRKSDFSQQELNLWNSGDQMLYHWGGEYMQQVSIIVRKLSIIVLRSSGVYFHFVGNIFPKIGGIFRGSMFALNLYKVLHSRSWHSCVTPWVCRQWIYNSSVWISSCICGKNSDPLCKECSVTGSHLGFKSIKSI